MRRKTIAMEKLALMLEAELGAGKVYARELATYKPPSFWTTWEWFRNFMTGYIPMEKQCRLDWTIGGYHCCNTTILVDALPVSLDDIMEKFVKPTAAKMRKYIRKRINRTPA